MTDKKPSTADIMAMLRKKPAEGASVPTPAPEAPATAAAEVTPAAVEAVAPAAKPKGTSDIMAAIRAKGAAPAASTPAAPAPVAATPAAAGAKPKGTSDIMAAIRAKGATPAAASSPAAASIVPTATVAPKIATPVAAGKSPAEMIKAMREGAAAAKSDSAVAIAEPVVAKPKLPAKAAAGKKQELLRRSFPGALFAALCVPYYMGWTLLSAIGGLWGLGMARFMMPNTVLELPSKFKVGSIGDYPLGTVSEKFKASRAVWIVHTDGYDGQNVIYALLSVCTHLGCTPSWLDAEQKFKCPCHGSGFYINGVNFEGPAPRPLERVGLVLGADGTLEVDKSVKFQEELGQWNDPKSYVKV